MKFRFREMKGVAGEIGDVALPRLAEDFFFVAGGMTKLAAQSLI